ncbi:MULTISPECIES: signal recognition particle-docking protein FtsY [Bosea]|uniref:signal recognition particle-docking protein FtsY n=1 Tax=Bosea TaxID=85413 RepID=UPI0021502797|nr:MULTISPECIES: signal recognition particle-docking protein FtsY [Bosea]MCR4524044.1 signal recognition particle-docking protein FtsY [Bosea sp. 47.2.35]MDR6831140.1 fused signal recognition particle receptor [Bosea robiniae]MDR6897859.1 fused signal recognition particle receptor [Bosea sp. BE109]MDR7141277.1 fused signal recognition particle receptor [Bosea sp. BE168]MDR7177939.1 fused signal recognition particle receptor [Bosea sp. BE271]
MSETEPKKRGFFSRLFGRDEEPAKPAPTPETVTEQAVEPVEELKPEVEEVAPAPVAETAAPAVETAFPEPVTPPALVESDSLPVEPEPEPAVAPQPAPVVVPEPTHAPAPQPKRSWWRRLTEGLSRTSSALTTGITDLFTKRKLDAGTLEDLEDILIQADLGLATSAKIAKAVGDGRYDKQIDPAEVKAILAREVESILVPVAQPLAIDATKKPFVLLMVGVNGSGKTTTIGKLAAKFRSEGKSVMLAAGDTFRAAAIEQLRVWGERTGAEVVYGQQGADAAGLAFEALQKAKANGTDALLIDTAGRLQNKQGLMDELAKVVRVIRKQDPSAPHAALLVLDATVGQNAISQVEAFRETAGVTGLVMTKLDGTARGGILVALAAQFGLPVHFIGVGESVEDLEPFSARDFARAVAGLGEAA